MEEQNMDVTKEYLNQIRVLDARINNLIEEKEHLWQSILPGGNGYGEKVQTSSSNSRYENWITRIQEKEEDINRNINQLADLRMRITGEINQLSDARYIRILYLRYVQLFSWLDIVDKTGYTYRHVTRLHGWALLEFHEKFKKCPKMS